MPIATNKKELIEQIRFRIEELGLSVRKVSNETGKSKTLVQNLLKKNPPNVSLEILLEIAIRYNISFKLEFIAKNKS